MDVLASHKEFSEGTLIVFWVFPDATYFIS